MALGEWPLQQALYSRLMAQMTGVDIYDHVPQNSEYPYVVISTLDVLTWDSKTFDGAEYHIDIHVFNKGAGKKCVTETLLPGVRAALHQQEAALAVTGYTVVLIRMDNEIVMQGGESVANDDRYYHGVQTYRILLQDT